MKDIIGEFIYFLETIKNKSLNTVKAYDCDLKQFQKYLLDHEEVNCIAEIRTQHLKSYIAYLFHHNVSKRSINRKASSIKSFLEYLKEQKLIEKDVSLGVIVPKFSKKLPTVLTLEEINRIRESIDVREFGGIRNRAMLELLYSSGIRASELLSIKESEVNYIDREIRVFGKGSKERDVFFSNTASEWLRHYSEAKRKKGYNIETLIVNQNGKPMTDRSLRRIVEEISNFAGILKHVSPHTFRHSFATHLMNKGVDLRYIQALLGHEHITTTEVYTHVSREKLKEELEKHHPFI